MIYTDNRDAYRQAFFTAWQKYKKQLPLEPVEAQLVDIIQCHPEYHALLDSSDQQQEFALEENPFFHMSLHLAIREQVQCDRPLGIKQIYETLCAQGNAHDAEHQMMTCLAKVLWSAQQTGVTPDEFSYLQKLRALVE